MPVHDENQAIAQRYARRAAEGLADRYSPLRAEVWQTLQERQRALIGLLNRHGRTPVADLHVAELGCGTGSNLLELLHLGFAPQHLTGVELLPERVQTARQRLPAALTLIEGDACAAPIAAASQDLVLAATVFSSVLDDTVQQRLANAMWRWLKPGGAVIWYDFAFNNPRNPDVRGVPLRRVHELFPTATISAQRVTLAPPLARLLCRLHPMMYTLANALPLLRTHRLAWIEKKTPLP